MEGLLHVWGGFVAFPFRMADISPTRFAFIKRDASC